ncbi:unnamed protein product [Prunus brigantina]
MDSREKWDSKVVSHRRAKLLMLFFREGQLREISGEGVDLR